MARWPLHQAFGWIQPHFRTLGSLRTEGLLYENPSLGFAQTSRFALLREFRGVGLRGVIADVRRTGNHATTFHGFIQLDQGRRPRVCVDARGAFLFNFRREL